MRVISNVLNMPAARCKKRLIVYTVLCCIAVAAALTLNVCLSVFRSDETHVAFLVVNIVVDVAAAWGVFTAVDGAIVPKYRLYKLNSLCSSRGEIVSGDPVEIGPAEKNRKTDCVTLTVSAADGVRKIFVVENTFEKDLIKYDSVDIVTVDNIAVMYGFEEGDNE